MSLEIIEYTANAGMGVIFPAKTYIAEEEDKVVVISPCKLPPEKIEWLKNCQKEIIIISPNNFHNLFLKPMKENFPQAKFYGPKRSAQQSGVELLNTKELKLNDIDVYPIAGNNALSETCFYHKPTKTLLVTDLFFNMHHQMNFPTRMAITMAGAYHKMATSRVIKFSTKDKELFKSSIAKLTELELDKVIPAHGEIANKQQFIQWSKQF